MFLFFTFGVIRTTEGVLTCNTTLSDADLSTCDENIILDLRKTWGPGIPSLGIPPVDPLTFDGMSVSVGNLVVNFQATVSNVIVQGLNGFTNLDISVNTTGHTATFSIKYPHLRVDGHYKANGFFTILPISGEGAFWFDFIGLQQTGSLKLRNATNGRVTFLEIYDVVLDTSISDYSFNFANLGGAFLGPLINSLLNFGRTPIFTELKPEINQKCGELMSLNSNPFLQTQAYMAGILKP